jgi:SAM-dependent methyltransferase
MLTPRSGQAHSVVTVFTRPRCGGTTNPWFARPRPSRFGEVIYQHPLAYLIGVEGQALLRGWAGDFDEAFVKARLAEVRRLVNDPVLAEHPGVDVARGRLEDGYQRWAATYDDPRNGLFDLDEPVVHSILDEFPAGPALDAACGTGRFASHLLARGHQVTGVDSSPDMLDVARRHFPAAEFLLGSIDKLPVADDSVDVVTCGLALSHLRFLGPAMSEFARVLRPGGHVVISDVSPGLILRGSVVQALGPAGEPGLVPTFRHSTGDYLRAALLAGLHVRHYDEQFLPEEDAARDDDGEQTEASATDRPVLDLGPWADWPWSLMPLVPEAMSAGDAPMTVVWHLQLPD